MRTPLDRLQALADEYGVPQHELLVLASGNDPFAVGRPADLKAARWFTDLYERLGSPQGLHLRDIHYGVLTNELHRADGTAYEGTDKDLHDLETAAKKARLLGMVPFEAFTEKRTTAEYDYDRFRRTPDFAPVILFEDEVREDWRLTRPQFWRPVWELPEAPTSRWVPTALSLQSVAIEIWIEKDSAALNEEVLPVAERHGCRVVIGAGYSNYTKANELVQRTIADARPRVLLWLSDADAAGESMPNAAARAIEFIHEHYPACPRVLVDVLCLTLDQLAGIEAEIGRKIPLIPDQGRDEGRVELQALAAFAPGWVRDELERRLDELADHDLADELEAWEVGADAEIEEAWEAQTAALRQAVERLSEERDAILERPLTLTGLKVALDQIEPERQRIEQEVRAILASFDVELPELPEGYVELDSGRDWLLDTDREFEDQLNAYRRHEPVHRRRPQLGLDGSSALCACGCGQMSGRRRYYNRSCRQRAYRARRRGGAA